jgi:hypothetical protein
MARSFRMLIFLDSRFRNSRIDSEEPMIITKCHKFEGWGRTPQKLFPGSLPTTPLPGAMTGDGVMKKWRLTTKRVAEALFDRPHVSIDPTGWILH